GDLRSAWLREPGWQDTFSPAVRDGPGVPPARRIGVTVTKDDIAIHFNGNRIGRVTRATIDQQIIEMWNRVGPPNSQAPLFDPTGRLGIFVQSSAVVVQSFRVTPRRQE